MSPQNAASMRHKRMPIHYVPPRNRVSMPVAPQSHLLRHKKEDPVRLRVRVCRCEGRLLGEAAEYVAHHSQQFERAGVAYPVKHAVGVLAGTQHALVAQNGQVLRDVAL